MHREGYPKKKIMQLPNFKSNSKGGVDKTRKRLSKTNEKKTSVWYRHVPK